MAKKKKRKRHNQCKSNQRGSTKMGVKLQTKNRRNFTVDLTFTRYKISKGKRISINFRQLYTCLSIIEIEILESSINHYMSNK